MYSVMREELNVKSERDEVPLLASGYYETSCALTSMSRPFGRTDRRIGSLDSGFRISTRHSCQRSP